MRAMPGARRLLGRRRGRRTRRAGRAGRPPPPRARRRRAASRRSPSPRRRVRPSIDGGPSRNGHGGGARPAADRTVPRRTDGPARAGALNRGAAGGRRSGTSSTTRSRRSGCACASWRPCGCGGGARPRPSRRRRRSPVAASAAACTAGTAGRRRALLDHDGLGDDGQPVDDLASSSLLRHRRPRTAEPTGRRRTCIVPNTRSQYGALMPKPRSSSWKWWRMCSSRSQLPDPRPRRVVVQGVVDHVVGQVARQEARRRTATAAAAPRTSQNSA